MIWLVECTNINYRDWVKIVESNKQISLNYFSILLSFSTEV
jgi:hypothetical protein